MTYDDVVGLIGAEPDSQSTMDLMGSEIIACTWYGEGSAELGLCLVKLCWDKNLMNI